MAVFQGKRPFPWTQHPSLCVPDPANNSAISHWQLALSQTKQALSHWPLAFSQTNPEISEPLCPGSPESPVLAFWGDCLRGGFSIGGRL
jgi:hypothetical protein